MPVFDAIAPRYDQWYETPLGRFADDVETGLVLDLLGPKPGMRVLDAGCGTGNFTVKLARRGVQVVGVDLSGGMLSAARDRSVRAGLEIPFLRMDLCALSLPDESFDAALSVTAFEFVRRREQAFSELMRVVKPGGSVVIGCIQGGSAWSELYERMSAQDESCIYRTANFPSLEDLRRLDEEGFVRSAQGLFIPPDIPPEKLSPEEEQRLARRNTGGFVAVLWRKPGCPAGLRTAP